MLILYSALIYIHRFTKMHTKCRRNETRNAETILKKVFSLFSQFFVHFALSLKFFRYFHDNGFWKSIGKQYLVTSTLERSPKSATFLCCAQNILPTTRKVSLTLLFINQTKKYNKKLHYTISKLLKKQLPLRVIVVISWKKLLILQ